MREVYGLTSEEKLKEPDDITDLGNLLHQKAILDLIRHGDTIEINSQLIKGYLTQLPGSEFKDLDIQYIREVDLKKFKKWDMKDR